MYICKECGKSTEKSYGGLCQGCYRYFRDGGTINSKWINFVPRRYSKKFKSLSDLAKYIYKNDICYMSSLHCYILHQLTKRECQILNAKIYAMYNKYCDKSINKMGH